MSRILIVYYSRTGHTHQVATGIASALGPDVQLDLEGIVDPTPRVGLLGYLRSGRQAFLRRLPPIAEARHQPAQYDLVVIGTPIWNVSLSAPVRSYLRRYHAELPAVAFFCTCGGAGVHRVFQQMAEESERMPVAELVVREAELGRPAAHQKIAAFVEQIRAAAAATMRKQSA